MSQCGVFSVWGLGRALTKLVTMFKPVRLSEISLLFDQLESVPFAFILEPWLMNVSLIQSFLLPADLVPFYSTVQILKAIKWIDSAHLHHP